MIPPQHIHADFNSCLAGPPMSSCRRRLEANDGRFSGGRSLGPRSEWGMDFGAHDAMTCF